MGFDERFHLIVTKSTGLGHTGYLQHGEIR